MTNEQNEPAGKNENPILKPWAKSRGPIKVDRHAFEAATAINALLIEPLAVLPSAEGEDVRPFMVGIRSELESRMKSDVATSDLQSALRRYVRCAAYLLATGQPDAYRYDIHGKPVEPVNEVDRRSARQSFTVVQQKRSKRRKEREAVDNEASDGAETVSKAGSRILAGAREALAFAKGEADESQYVVHTPKIGG